MKAYYSDTFELDLPEAHAFPMSKYGRLVAAVREQLTGVELLVPEPATDAELLRAHDARYLRAVVSGTQDARAVRRMGFPWSEALVRRSRLSCGATLAACRDALASGGCAVNLGGGTHHADRGHAEGFCVFNDTAVALLALRAEGVAGRGLAIDCDVHQGNGTASILSGTPELFTFSIHGAKNFPLRKVDSDLDIGLQDGTTDAAYLTALGAGLADALRRSRPAVAVYLAGADPFETDRFGRLALTKAGLAARDRLVLEGCRGAGVPVAVVMAGGYAPDVADIVDIHVSTVRTALEVFG